MIIEECVKIRLKSTSFGYPHRQTQKYVSNYFVQGLSMPNLSQIRAHVFWIMLGLTFNDRF